MIVHPIPALFLPIAPGRGIAAAARRGRFRIYREAQNPEDF
jgi:hypothetical protein